MKHICPYCGKKQIVSDDPYVDPETGKTVYGVEHMICPKCKGISFTADQLMKKYGQKAS